jgi:hypothetical protein
MNREAELAAIERFLSSSGATRCPAAYAAPTVGRCQPTWKLAAGLHVIEGGTIAARDHAGPVREPDAALGLNGGFGPAGLISGHSLRATTAIRCASSNFFKPE